jgi:hypothetical protein
MDTFVALKVTLENVEQIITEAPTLTLPTIEKELELSKLHGLAYYLVPNYIGKNMREEYPWVMIREDKFEEDFNYTLPENDTEKFEITRK